MDNTAKYFAYLRKSSEGLERQALSIPAQKAKLAETFGYLDIEFVQDSASAFKPFNRPAFADMLERIRKGGRTGLIAWHPDRLSRNEKDAGEITYMLRSGVITDLKLATYHFENTPEGIWMLQMALSQSQYESAKKGRDVKRGLAQSASMGFYPAQAPIGYIDDKYTDRGKKQKKPDPERFHLVRKMFDLMLTGKYTAAQILNIVNEEWGFRTPRGHKLSLSTLYYTFTRSFYYGRFEYPTGSGNWIEGNHEPMITRTEYDRIQALLGRNDAPRPKQHEMAYRGPMHCGNCGAMVTAEEKVRSFKNGTERRYVYYRCTRHKDPTCTELAISEKDLEMQIAEALRAIEIPNELKEWALAKLREQNEQESADRNHIYGAQRREYEACVRKIDSLIDMRAGGEITEQEFSERKKRLLADKERFSELLKDTDKRVDNWLEIAEQGFNFAEKAAAAFNDACARDDIEMKREIFSALGSDLTLKDKKLSISLDSLLFPIQQAAKAANSEKDRLEPTKNGGTAVVLGEIYSEIPRMLGD